MARRIGRLEEVIKADRIEPPILIEHNTTFDEVRAQIERAGEEKMGESQLKEALTKRTVILLTLVTPEGVLKNPWIEGFRSKLK